MQTRGYADKDADADRIRTKTICPPYVGGHNEAFLIIVVFKTYKIFIYVY